MAHYRRHDQLVRPVQIILIAQHCCAQQRQHHIGLVDEKGGTFNWLFESRRYTGLRRPQQIAKLDRRLDRRRIKIQCSPQIRFRAPEPLRSCIDQLRAIGGKQQCCGSAIHQPDELPIGLGEPVSKLQCCSDLLDFPRELVDDPTDHAWGAKRARVQNGLVSGAAILRT